MLQFLALFGLNVSSLPSLVTFSTLFSFQLPIVILVSEFRLTDVILQFLQEEEFFKEDAKSEEEKKRDEEKMEVKENNSSKETSEKSASRSRCEGRKKGSRGTSVDKKEKKKIYTKDPYLLLAFIYFDTTRTGYIVDKDLEDIINLLGLNLSRAQVS